MDKTDLFKAYIVSLILDGKLDKALDLLSDFYHVSRPKLKVKHLKGHSKALATYSLKNKTIYVQNGDYYTNPLVILHEFYHHLRNVQGKHRGTEDNANKFAIDFIEAYRRIINKLSEDRD